MIFAGWRQDLVAVSANSRFRKTNPVPRSWKGEPPQSESLTMVSAQVMGNAAATGFAASQGNLELNVFKPAIVFNFSILSAYLLTDAVRSMSIVP
jgi:fumarate hydratase class II